MHISTLELSLICRPYVCNAAPRFTAAAATKATRAQGSETYLDFEAERLVVVLLQDDGDPSQTHNFRFRETCWGGWGGSLCVCSLPLRVRIINQGSGLALLLLQSDRRRLDFSTLSQFCILVSERTCGSAVTRLDGQRSLRGRCGDLLRFRC